MLCAVLAAAFFPNSAFAYALVKLFPGVPMPLEKIFPETNRLDSETVYWYLAIGDRGSPKSQVEILGGTPGTGILFGQEMSFRYFDQGSDPYYGGTHFSSIKSGAVLASIEAAVGSVTLAPVVLQKAVVDPNSYWGYSRINVLNGVGMTLGVGRSSLQIRDPFDPSYLKKEDSFLDRLNEWYGRYRRWLETDGGENQRQNHIRVSPPTGGGGVRGSVDIFARELYEGSPATAYGDMIVDESGLLEFVMLAHDVGDGDSLHLFVDGEHVWGADLAGLTVSSFDTPDSLSFYSAKVSLPHLAGKSVLATFYLDSVGESNARVSVLETLEVSPASEPSPVPEPSTAALVGMGASLLALRWRARLRSGVRTCRAG